MKKLVFILSAFLCIFTGAFANDGYEIGANVSDFKLKNVDGKMVSLADYPDAKGFIISFTCNHCPFSIAYEDRILALDKKYATSGYPVIAINPNDAENYPDDSYENMKIRANEKQFTFPYLYDESQEIAKQFGAKRTPHMYILQKEGGKLIVKYIGAIDDNWESPENVEENYVANAMDAILENKPVAMTTTKAIGCTIKWKK